MNNAEVIVAAVAISVALADGCIVLWSPPPFGVGLHRPRLPRHIWLYPRSLRERGIV